MSVMGTLAAIWIKRAHRGPMDAAEQAQAVAGAGLVGNADQGGRRQVTLVDEQRWHDAERELGAEVDPAARRANLLTRGLDYRESADRIVRVGTVRIRLLGETRPCARMDEARPGLRAALQPDWRAGAYGEVLDDGPLRVGDPVDWES
jgi:MOSC domain-containing protein YiiM